jgi:ubiquinol-cytochrome c reductase cytochrome b subunit
MTLVFQVARGFLLVLNYNTLQRYERVSYIVREVYLGWFIKLFHSNNARVIFFLLYLHLYKNVLMRGYRLTST